MSHPSMVRAFAPATVANVAVGFDCLGFAIDALGDTVEIERVSTPGVHIQSVSGDFPKEPEKNTATAGMLQMQRDFALDFGFRVRIEKGIPRSSGLGGSAASAIAGTLAAAEFLPRKLSKPELLEYALIGEAIASGGRHADNLAPCLWGGMVLIGEKQQVIPLPVPSDLRAVVVHPELELQTSVARGVLKRELTLASHILHSARLASLIHACHTADFTLIHRSLNDELIEPQRQFLIPGFLTVKSAALEAGALGCSISGAGPSVFAWTQGDESAKAVLDAMLKAWKTIHRVQGWISPVGSAGAHLL